MAEYRGLSQKFQPDWRALVENIRRKGTPKRVHFGEIFADREVGDAIEQRFDLLKGVSKSDPDYVRLKYIAVQRFCGLDFAVTGLCDLHMGFNCDVAEDTAGLKREGGRSFVNSHTGPITNWEEFEKFKWPDPTRPECLRDLEWYQKNLPDDMCIAGGLFSHFCEEITWLMGYETFCMALYDDRKLIEAVVEKLEQYYRDITRLTMTFDRVKLFWGTDDMGFKTGLLMSADDMRKYVLPGHREAAKIVHDHGGLYLLHSCGKLDQIMPDLLDDVKIDAKHSFEDTIESVCDAKNTYGRRTALIGGMDIDFLCRSDEQAIRARVRKTLDVCLPGGGYCLGTGNSVANYVPLDSYLAMIDEGRLYTV